MMEGATILRTLLILAYTMVAFAAESRRLEGDATITGASLPIVFSAGATRVVEPSACSCF